MKLRFLGACRQVGRSQLEVDCGGLSLLVDSGTASKGERFPLLPSREPDACIVSHCHLDHSGFLPLFYRKRRFPWLSTFPTVPLASLLWHDVIKVLSSRGEVPYFSEKEIKEAGKHSVCLPYGEAYEFFDGTAATLFDAGHIVGSSQVLVESGSKALLYTGDLNYSDTRNHRKAVVPLKGVDALVLESTYGDRDHPARRDVERAFVDAVEEACEEGNAIVPCFAVGRTQEVLQVLEAHGVKYRVWVDGMGQKTCELAADFPSYFRDSRALARAVGKAGFIEDGRQRRQVAGGRGNVIVTTAGMLDGGPALSYINYANRAGKGAVLLTGFQVPGTNGAMLVSSGRLRDKGRITPISLPVRQFDFSAHSGRREMVSYVNKVQPRKVFCIHGDEGVCESLAATLEGEGFDATAPEAGSEFKV
ncbi:MAG: MBL fold metallo-hydrolase [Candidatus Micrarchaeota archaeon]